MKKALSWAGTCLGGFAAGLVGEFFPVTFLPVFLLFGPPNGERKKMALICAVSAALLLILVSVLYFVHDARKRRNCDRPRRLLTAAYCGFAAGLAVVVVFMIVTATATGEGIITGF